MLRSLDLSHCGMGDEGAYVLRGALMGHPTMRTLDLSRNRIGITGGQVWLETSAARFYPDDTSMPPSKRQGKIAGMSPLPPIKNHVDNTVAIPIGPSMSRLCSSCIRSVQHS